MPCADEGAYPIPETATLLKVFGCCLGRVTHSDIPHFLDKLWKIIILTS